MKRHILGIALLLALAASAQEGSRVEQVAFETLWAASGALVAPIGDEPETLETAIPALRPDEDAVLVLRFRARMRIEAPAGWNNYLGLAWNGEAIGERTADGRPRCLNRRASFQTDNPRYPEVPLVRERAGTPCFNVFFGPAEPRLEMVSTDLAEGYWYLLDLTGLPLERGGNQLTVTNTAVRSYWGDDGPPEGCALVLEDLAVGTISRAALDALRGAHLHRRRALRGVPVSGSGHDARVTGSGGVRVTIGGEPYHVESSFSFPRDGGMGHNRFSCEGTVEGEPGWSPQVEATSAAVLVRAEGAGYTVERRITREPHRVQTALVDGEETPLPDEQQFHLLSGRLVVTDTITNRGDEVLGLCVQHRIITPDYPTAATLAGLDVVSIAAGDFVENPTVYVAQRDSGLGATPEDNAMRLQSSRRRDENSVVFGSERLGLAPGESYTLRLALYPSTPEYFDFINQLRWDWDVNFTVDGPCDFFDARRLATPEGRDEARALLARKRMKWFALTPWFEYYNGWGMTRDEYRALMTEARSFLKGVVPDARFMACIETNLVPVPLSFFGDSIPADGWPIGRAAGGKYGQAATPAMTAYVDASPWRDSCLRDADGNVLLDCWYVQHYADKPAVNLMVYPAFDNYRRDHMREQVAWLLDEAGFDGVYIDQFSLAWSSAPQRYSKEGWDGRTVTLDADGRVLERWTDLGLVSAQARRDVVTDVLDRGKTVVANTLPAVFELQSLPVFRFTETQGYDPLAGEGAPYMPQLARGQLGSPIGLGHSFPKDGSAEFFTRCVAAHLRFGQLYYHYMTEFPSMPIAEGDEATAPDPRAGEFGPVNQMFPFTPVELHEGWILGEERMITCVSGEFPWRRDDRRPKVTVFDRRGVAVPEPDVHIAWRGGKYSIRVKLDDWREVAVAE